MSVYIGLMKNIIMVFEKKWQFLYIGTRTSIFIFTTRCFYTLHTLTRTHTYRHIVNISGYIFLSIIIIVFIIIVKR